MAKENRCAKLYIQIQRNYVARYSKIPYCTIEKGQIHETRSLLLSRATIKILCNLGMKLELYTLRFSKDIDRLLTLLIHDNATRIDFFYLHACHGIIEHSFNENITKLKIIC